MEVQLNTYVHTNLELLDILPTFAGGCRLNVLVCIGLFDSTPEGASLNDILVHTRLSQATVKHGLESLKSDGLVEENRGYFRPTRYFSYNKGLPGKNFSSSTSTISIKKPASTTNIAEKNVFGVQMSYEAKLE